MCQNKQEKLQQDNCQNYVNGISYTLTFFLERDFGQHISGSQGSGQEHGSYKKSVAERRMVNV